MRALIIKPFVHVCEARVFYVVELTAAHICSIGFFPYLGKKENILE